MPILDWLNRDKDVRAADSVPYRLLHGVDELCYGDPASPNMLIQGDNLEALKALLPYYSGQVKCIFIDPPYNTKSAFEHYDDNLEHSEWLSMMYPRIELLRELLSEDGSIWVTIDDNEAHYLKVIMDEIFGRKNFIANCVWQKKYGPANDAKWLSDTHDHILVFAKNKNIWRPNLTPRDDGQLLAFKNPDDDPRGLWRASDLSVKTLSQSCVYEIIGPTGKVFLPPPTRAWAVNKEKFDELVKDNRIWWGAKSETRPMFKKFLSEVKNGITVETWWPREFADDNKIAKYESKSLHDGDSFATPKPEKLLQKLIHISTNPNDLVLDSFLGSGTTAAVAHKMGRRYIGIEMGDHAETHCQPRLKKVVDGEQGGISEAVGWTGGGGFRYYKLGSTIFDTDGDINPDIRFPHLAAHIWFCETKTAYHLPKKKSPLLGIHNGVAYYLLYNGILGDKSVSGGNVLTNPLLNSLPPHDGAKVIYGETSRITQERLKALDIVFKQTPYDVKAK